MLVNTSFNVRGEPIVCTPEDAYRCFASTDIDELVLGNFLVGRDAKRSEALAPATRVQVDERSDVPM